jgi:O-antigen ligase
MLSLVIWLFTMADSQTSVACFVIGVCILVFTHFQFIKRNIPLIGVCIISAGFVFMIVEYFIGIVEFIVVDLLGRDMTLTDRTNIWALVLQMETNPIFGTGFQMFWSGERLIRMWLAYWWQPMSAHNGYIETYLDLGLVGVGLLAGFLISSFNNISKTLNNFGYGRLCLVFFLVSMIYNLTESSFLKLSFIWFVLMLVSFAYKDNITKKKLKNVI